MTEAASPTSKNSHISFFYQVKTKVDETYQKVNDFIKNNFLKLMGFTLVVGSYFAFGVEVSIGLIGAIATYQVVSKLINIFKTSRFSAQKVFPEIRKIVLSPNGNSSFLIASLVFLNRKFFHDNIKWLKDYKSTDLLQKRQMRKEIGLQTLEFVNSFRKYSESNKQNTNIIGSDIKTKYDENKYFDQALAKNTLSVKEKQKVEIIQGDSFDVAITLKEENEYKKVAVLNMANKDKPGGGFLNGSSAQEETLCRRSNLFDSINIHPIGKEKTNYNPYLEEKMNGKYGVPEFGAIYSPNVTVFRGNPNKEGYAIKNDAEVNVISSAAYDIAHSSKPRNYRENTKRKLQMVLNTALENNEECVVLGAFGCGAFGNNPKEVASIVKEILEARPIYQKKMKIVFGIIKDGNDKNGNLENFSVLQGL